MSSYAERFESWKARYFSLSPAEKLALAQRPQAVGSIKDASEKALSEAKKRFSKASQEDGKGDAFRHCYWTALLVRDVGVQNALAIKDAHEDRPDNKPKSREMDQHNNRLGMLIGIANGRATDEELVALCLQALSLGKLIVLKPNL